METTFKPLEKRLRGPNDIEVALGAHKVNAASKESRKLPEIL